MSRKKCRRKVWSTTINPIAHAMAGAAITDQKALDKLRLSELAAIDNIVYGRGTVEDWRWCADFMNIAETMAKNGIGPEVLPVCQEVQQALFDAAKRYETTKKIVLSGVGIKALKDLWEYHDLQRTSIARSEYEKMIQKTANYIRSHGKDIVEIA